MYVFVCLYVQGMLFVPGMVYVNAVGDFYPMRKLRRSMMLEWNSATRTWSLQGWQSGKARETKVVFNCIYGFLCQEKTGGMVVKAKTTYLQAHAQEMFEVEMLDTV